MKRIILLLSAAMAIISCSEPYQWAPAGENIRTKWADEVNPENVRTEYPRPQMVRSQWQSLNGLWDYAITEKGAESFEAEGKILVPFGVESSLSGVGRTLTANDALWYKTTFKVPSDWKKQNIVLNFEGVDWETQIWINGNKLETHTGAYTEFSYDITPYLKPGKQEVILKVYDATDNDFQPRGKQISRPSGIWYTADSGIWQSVWMEPVPKGSIADYNTVADIDASSLAVTVDVADAAEGDVVKVELLEGAVGYSTAAPSSKVLATAEAPAGQELNIAVPGAELWSPENPYLYGMKITLLRGGKVQDEVQAYTSMRKISVVTDDLGYKRMALNNKALFQFGPLDQGWWPDGLHTAPTDEAMRYDLEMTKNYGFNMIRKHIKVEPATWYYACDQLGIVVWQDMPSFADNQKNRWNTREIDGGTDYPVTPEIRANYYKEWGEIIAQRKKFHCIVVWVPFNEAWGQFDTPAAVKFTYEQDPTRLVNMASGGNWVSGGVGDIIDAHNYPHPRQNVSDPDMVNVVGEYGGIGMPVKDHLWQINRQWGYINLDDSAVVTDTYVEYAMELKDLVKTMGTSAAVYTQTTDVEGEVNGLMTYDRAINKLDVKRVAEANKAVIDELQ